MGLGGIHPVQLLIVLALLLLVFGGRGKISSIMKELAGGVRSFRKGLSEEEKDGAGKVLDVEVESDQSNMSQSSEEQNK